METNASKALLMAGGILIGIILLTFLVYVFTQFSSFFNSQNIREKNQQIVAFNQQYEQYTIETIEEWKASDMVTVINMAKSNNTRYDNNAQYRISVIVTYDGREINENSNEQQLYTFLKEYAKEDIFFEYDINSISYNDAGRVCKIKFKRMLPPT